MARRTVCGGPVWFQPPGGGFGPGCETDFGGYFKQPVCGGGGVPPVPPFPGLLQLDFRNGPHAQQFPTTAAGCATALGVPAATPSILYSFDETSGNTVSDLVGTAHLTRESDAELGVWATGLGDGAGNVLTHKRCGECHQSSATGRFVCTQAQAFWIDADESFGCMLIYRVGSANLGSTRDFICGDKENPIGGDGNWIQLATNGLWFQTRRDGAVAPNGRVCPNEGIDGGWHIALFAVNYPDNTVYAASENGSDSGPLGGGPYGVIQSTLPWQFGGAVAGRTGSALFQIAYFAWFKGAAAIALGNCVAPARAFFQHDLDPNELLDTPPIQNGGTQDRRAEILAIDSDDGVQLGEWGYRQYPFAARDSFTHASKLGVMSGYVGAFQNGVRYSDEIENLWTATNATISAAQADLTRSPWGMLQARKVTASANNGYIEENPTTGAASWEWGCFVKRHPSMGADVNGRFQHWNSAGAEIAGVDFVATEKWQNVHLTSVGVGANDRIRIRINTSGEALAVFRVYSYRTGQRNIGYTLNSAFDDCTSLRIDGTMPAIEAWCEAAAGEIEITFAMESDTQSDGQTLLWFDNGIPLPAIDTRHIAILPNNTGVRFEHFDDLGASTTVDAPALANPTLAHVVRARWNAAVAQFAGPAFSEIIVDAVTTQGSLVGWNVDGNALSRLLLFDTYTNAEECGAIIALIRIWDAPQP